MPRHSIGRVSMLMYGLLVCAGSFFFTASALAYTFADSSAWSLSADLYLRMDAVNFRNVVDLDSGNSDDSADYLGLDYSLGIASFWKEADITAFLKLERNGPYDYSAPIWQHNTLMTSGGIIEKYRGDELLPQLEEFWLLAPLLGSPVKVKAGLYTYEVANGFSLSGGYENYGISFLGNIKQAEWRLYYCRPDIHNKNHLGPRIRQDEEQGIEYEHGPVHFFASDVKYSTEKGYIWPYVGMLADYAAPDKRTNLFSAPIKRDLLGTFGIGLQQGLGKFTCTLEAARNFGRAKNNEDKDVEHAGYLTYAGLEYEAGKCTPSLRFLLASGNKATPEMAQNLDTVFSSGRNRAFSYYSPLNTNRLDSMGDSNSDMLPIVAMGGGYGLNYGVPRPGTFSAADFDNLIMPSIGVKYTPCEKLEIEACGYYLRSFERGVGTWLGEGKYLPRDLGWEADLFVDYRLTPSVSIGFLGGYFRPGRFYRQERDDTDGSILTPFIRGDGDADSAFQLELALTVQL